LPLITRIFVPDVLKPLPDFKVLLIVFGLTHGVFNVLFLGSIPTALLNQWFRFGK
jgi:hypothetical protein